MLQGIKFNSPNFTGTITTTTKILGKETVNSLPEADNAKIKELTDRITNNPSQVEFIPKETSKDKQTVDVCFPGGRVLKVQMAPDKLTIKNEQLGLFKEAQWEIKSSEADPTLFSGLSDAIKNFVKIASSEATKVIKEYF